MSARRSPAAIALICAAVAGCGVGPGDEQGSAELRVTRDYGAELVAEGTVDGISDSENALRMLEREAEITTRYAGRFVQSIDGIEGGSAGGRRQDWFFYVNGVESPVGSADVPVRDGDRVWWDFRDWTDAMRAPAVVGSWPAPFAEGFEDNRDYMTRIDCLIELPVCERVRRAFADAGVEAGIFEAEQAPGHDAEAGPTLRVLVGTWARVGADRAAAQIDEGPERSGVFARFAGSGGGTSLLGLDVRGRPAERLGKGTGLVAAVRFEETPPTWVVTGTDAAGVDAAAGLLDEDVLLDRYAVASAPGREPIALPVGEGGGDQGGQE